MGVRHVSHSVSMENMRKGSTKKATSSSFAFTLRLTSFHVPLLKMLRRPFSSASSLTLLDMQAHFPTQKTTEPSLLTLPLASLVTPPDMMPSSAPLSESMLTVPVVVRSRRLLFHDSDLTASSLELTDLEENEQDFTRDDLSSSFMDVESPPPL